MIPLKTIILDGIACKDDYDPKWTEIQSFRWLLDYALKCKKYDYEKYGAIHALTEFFQGMGLNICYWDNGIKDLGHDPETYWENLALSVLSDVD